LDSAKEGSEVVSKSQPSDSEGWVNYKREKRDSVVRIEVYPGVYGMIE